MKNMKKQNAKRIIAMLLCALMAAGAAVPVSASCSCKSCRAKAAAAAAAAAAEESGLTISSSALDVYVKCTAGLSISGNKNKAVWTSSDSSIVSVTDSGWSTATIKGNKEGTATITAAADGKTVSCVVTVKAKSQVKNITVKLKPSCRKKAKSAKDCSKNSIYVYLKYSNGKTVRCTNYTFQVKYEYSYGVKTSYIHIMDKDSGMCRDVRVTNGYVTYKTTVYKSATYTW